MPNEIIIRVKAINDTKVVFDKIRAEAKDLGETVAVNINEHVTQRLERDAQAGAGGSGGYARTGDLIGKTIGDHISERITERIKVDVNERLRDSRGRFTSNGNGNGREKVNVDVHDREKVNVDVNVDKKSLLEQLSSFGSSVRDRISNFFQGGISTGITSVFSGDFLSTLLKGSLIALGGTVLAPALGGAIGAAVLSALSGGAIGIGIIGALKDPRIQGALNSLKEQVKGTFASFSENFKGPLEEFLAPSNEGGGGIMGLLHQITPLIEHLGKVLGPIAGQLGNGIIGMLQNLLPPIIRAMEAGAPLITTLAKQLPGIGKAIGSLFDQISSHADDANTFWNDLLHVIKFLIIAIGALIGAFLNFYSIARHIFVALTDTVLSFASIAIKAFLSAFDWIPGLGPKIRGAEARFDKFRQNVTSSLSKIPEDKYIDVHIQTILNGVGTSVGRITRQLQGIGAVGHAFGGAVATAASGGARNGLTLVGERGPELINAAPGSQVYSNADTNRMLSSGGGGGGAMIINLVVDGMVIARATADSMRKMVLNQYGGNVQAAYGR